MTRNSFVWERGDWREQAFDALKANGIAQLAHVPDAGHTPLIDAAIADPDIEATVLTTEEEGVALLAGADLGGQRGVMLMQSSGVGNCINMLSVVAECRFPLLAIVTMRGEWGEFNPWQVPMGQGVARALGNAGVIVHHVEDADDLAATVAAASELAFNAFRAVAVAISQRVIGMKDWR